MHRSILAIAAAFGLAISTGCSMCESCFDYTYPAYGGKYCWEADDCCRAGSAFCHVVHGPGLALPVDEVHDPVPNAPYVPDPEFNQEALVPPPPNERMTPDLAPPLEAPSLPPVEVPNTGAPEIDDLELPPLRPVN